MKKREKKKLAKRVARRSDCSEKFAKLIIAEAERQDMGLPLAFSLFEQESNFEVIYGGDYGPVDGPPFYHIEVTKRNYLREFRPYVSSTHRSNGVGLGQITYYTYISMYRGLWKPRVQIRRSLEILKDNIIRLGLDAGVNAYNGDPTGGYGREVLGRVDRWKKILRR